MSKTTSAPSLNRPDVTAVIDLTHTDGTREEIGIPRQELFKLLSQDRSEADIAETATKFGLSVQSINDLLPSIQNESNEVNTKLRSPWYDPSIALIYNFDWEDDDEQRDKSLMKKMIERREGAGGSTYLPRTAIMATERNGVDPETFDGVVKLFSHHFGQMPEFSDGTKATWNDWNVSVLQGAGLRAMPEDDADPRKNPEKRRGRQTAEAATRLSEWLNGDEFVYHNNSSATLFASLPPSVQKQCIVHTETCSMVLTQRGEITNAGNQWFHPPAHKQVQSVLSQNGTKSIFAHGSIFMYDKHALSDLPGWNLQTVSKMTDPVHARKKVRLTMGLATRWASQVDASLKQTYTDKMMPTIESRLDAATESVMGKASSEVNWLHQATNIHHYQKELVDLTRALRVRVFATNANNAHNSTQGDLVGLPLDGPVSMGETYLGFEISGEEAEDGITIGGGPGIKGPITSFRVKTDSPNTYMVTGFSEDDFHEHFKDTTEFFAKRFATSDEVESGDYLVDEALAKDFMVFKAVMDETASDALTTIDDRMARGDVEADMETIKSAFEAVKARLEDGLMVSLARAKLSSIDD